MTVYELLLFVHIVSIVLWVGGAAMFSMLASRGAKNAPADGSTVVHTAEQAEWLGTSFYTPIALVTLASGIGLVLKGSWGFDHFFVVVGIGMIVVAAALGGAFYSKQTRALVEGIKARGFDAEAQATLKRIVVVSNIELALLFVAIFSMVVKPFE